MRKEITCWFSVKYIFVFFVCHCIATTVHAQIVLQTDFTDSANAKQIIVYHLNVFNRITPINGVNVTNATSKTKLCIVRPLGGIAKKGKADLTMDSYKWDAVSKTFYTDFTQLKRQIDGVYDEGLEIHQIVLDNPSWAFQRNAKGALLGDSLRVSTYGNAEPPKDYNVWANYLKDVMSFLVDTYGKDEVLKIQFDIGREIGTPTHWSGTKEQFFEFYKVSVKAIKQELPKAKVGTHFLWGSSQKAWGTNFVKWCKTNKVHYDFVGVSFYPFYHMENRTNFNQVYLKDFAVIKDIPEWNENAKLEMHEFALIKSLSKAGNAFENAPVAHQNSFIIGLMKMFYQNNMYNVFQWGDGKKYEGARNMLLTLEGNTYYNSNKSGVQRSEKNYVDAIFSRDSKQDSYHIVAYNYSANLESKDTESLRITAKLNVPPWTKIMVRSAVYISKEDAFTWYEWHEVMTKGNESSKSMMSFDTQLPVYSFLKYEIKLP
ncbi:glycosyl hydrolase 53 family protein [Tamlana fucoidanivorans]|uniref:Glycosyl hydrolases family 39 N-terminal catalytic domain-containing protein n=1 Tax=Allotamlana fucoidanivorans TaxID=2583814 RepID=A0A5C4SLX8_9FLAO|nr:alpha-1,4-L-rhamnosidase [Tamlana fucoidanivorans]TNJ45003.1 hypothetical protein FGF67_07560 [Tamlana fucoidanivorans]